MPTLDPGLLEWAVRAAAPGAEVAEVRGLRDGGSPWLVRRRVTCCLNYTVAGQPCATCPLLPPSETRRRLLAPA